MTGAQAGKNALENNNLLLPRPVVVPVPGLPQSPGDKVVQNANNNIASAFDKALNGAGIEVDTPPVTDGPSIVEARDEAARSRNSNMALNQQHTDEAGSKTETVPVNDDLTGGKLVNPAQEESKGTWLVTPDRSVEQAASNTGNTEGAPDTGGSSTVTPIPGQNKDDLAYLAGGKDNRLPIPEPTIASNGLKVESNSKHTPGGQGFRPNAGIEPRNSLELFGNSVSIDGNKARYSIGNDGAIHRYFPDNTGDYHWSGSTGDEKNPMQLDNKTKAQLRKQEGWKIK